MDYNEYIRCLPTEHPLKNISYDSYSKIRSNFFSDLNMAFISLSNDKLNHDWFENKKNLIINNPDIDNISSILGEFRAYSYFKNSLFGNSLLASHSNGADFQCNTIYSNSDILIEVHTPRGRQNENRTIIRHNSSQSDDITTQITEHAPYGFPERPQDNIQCEAVSRISQIKEEESQFDSSKLNILYIDFVNPFFSDHLDVLNDQQKPFIYFQDTITSGVLWHAFYAKRGNKIFQSLNPYYHRNIYTMEFDGRFHRSSKINFVFINISNSLVIYENPNRLCSDNNLYKMIFTLKKINYDDVWINWPNPILKERIDSILMTGLLFDEYFRIN